jgi:transposase InsO family protein
MTRVWISLVIDAIRAAAPVRGTLAGAVFHSDHGAQYTFRELVGVCAELDVRQSMGAVGTSADNALAESFDAALKRETLRGAHRFDGVRACRLAVPACVRVPVPSGASAGRGSSMRPGGPAVLPLAGCRAGRAR